MESRRHLVSAFLRAANEGSVDVSKFGQPVKSGWGSDPEDDEIERVEEELLDKSIRDSSPIDMTPLMIACFKEKPLTAEILLQRRADPNVCDSADNTAMHIAAMRGSLNMVQLLLKHKANIDPRNQEGKTPKDVSKAFEIQNIYVMDSHIMGQRFERVRKPGCMNFSLASIQI